MKKTIWLLCKILFFLLIAFAFSPFVLAEKNMFPFLFEMPRTLWIGLLVALGFITLTLVGAIVINSKDKKR